MEKEVESSIEAVITRAETDKVEVKKTVKMAENVTVAVGKGSREAAEEVAVQLPEGGKLKQVGIVENVTKETTTETHLVEEVNDKVEKQLLILNPYVRKVESRKRTCYFHEPKYFTRQRQRQRPWFHLTLSQIFFYKGPVWIGYFLTEPDLLVII